MNSTEQKRTVTDRIISNARSVYYGIYEPRQLKVARKENALQQFSAQKEPFISVYVPTYNRGDILIERAVSSVLNQTYTNFEFIIIGDHCTDNTENLVKKIKDKRIRFYNIPQRGYRYPPTPENHWFAGPVIAANTALEMVKGDWIARIDDDDIWTDDHLEVLLNFAQKGDFEFVSSSYMTIRQGKEIIVDERDQIPRIGGTQTWLYRSYLKFFKYNIDCWRKAWNRVNDTDIQDRIYKAGVKMGFLDQVTCHIIPRPGEDTIGLEAYRATADEKMEHFKFTD
ncbi:MAG: glycosyltransferase [Proteobacteria bacterium]|nr:glycosyltransferase [Pseudomonadota bacterium]MBU1583875.1 glycosyltransferase [Pseudomonadota bacterium]MBU2452779.1 glycosyltransferase [Pseudomonadota bacterium]MBU2627936.1 glycosyltransferase [Pseudomonadota bacterium]